MATQKGSTSTVDGMPENLIPILAGLLGGAVIAVALVAVTKMVSRQK